MASDETTLDPERRAAIAQRYRRLSSAFADKVAAVPDDRWGSPSPCQDWTARDVVQHVVDSSGMFFGFVSREPPDAPSVEEDPVAAFDTIRTAVQADLDDPERAGTEFEGYSGRSTFADAVDRFLAFDLVVHGWDLARATGLDEAIDPAELDRIAETAETMGPMLRSSGAFGAEVEVAPDADQQTRLLAFLGRQA
jgi:uncharacterized protein (TIGR03086 family)